MRPIPSTGEARRQQYRDVKRQAQRKKFWSMDLCLSTRGMRTVPFHYLVTPGYETPADDAKANAEGQGEGENVTDSGAATLFPGFCNLPAELRHLICSHCDIPTLFALMRASPQTRPFATKLFWEANGKIVYRTRPYVLEHYSAGLTGKIPHCDRFARHVTNLEITLDTRTSKFYTLEKFNLETAPEFWAAITGLFPFVQAVTLAGLPPPRALQDSTPSKATAEFDAMRAVLDLAPASVQDLFWAHPSQIGPYRLWRLRRGGQQVDSMWVFAGKVPWPRGGNLPARRSTNRLFEIMSLLERERVIKEEHGGIKWLREETFIRYATEDGAECSSPECASRFTEKQMRSSHIDAACRISSIVPTPKLVELIAAGGKWCDLNTPEEVKRVLRARIGRVAGMQARHDNFVVRLWGEFGDEGSPARKEFQRDIFTLMKDGGFLQEGEDPEQSDVWQFDVCETLQIMMRMVRFAAAAA
jgi:hypothetical protein